MPAAKYKSNNAYETDYGRYSRSYSQNRSVNRSPYVKSSYSTQLRPLNPPAYVPRRTYSAPVSAPPARQAVQEPRLNHREAAARRKAAKRNKFKTVVKCAVIFALAILMLYRYVQISESGAKINELQKEYNSLSGTAQELQSKIDKAIDLDGLERRAQEDLGMVRPDRNQIFYVDMNGDNYGEGAKTQETSGSLSGASGSMIRAIDMIK